MHTMCRKRLMLREVWKLHEGLLSLGLRLRDISVGISTQFCPQVQKPPPLGITIVPLAGDIFFTSFHIV
jgi:hypothetical protein